MVASKLDYILAQGLTKTRRSDVSRESLDEKDDDRREDSDGTEVHLKLFLFRTKSSITLSIDDKAYRIDFTTMSKRTDEPKEVLNISAGNQPITEDPKPLKPEDRRTGDFKQDFWSAFRVRLCRILFGQHMHAHSPVLRALFAFLVGNSGYDR
jgi:hypothetical protein